jgi:hypothetical protein
MAAKHVTPANQTSCILQRSIHRRGASEEKVEEKNKRLWERKRGVGNGANWPFIRVEAWAEVARAGSVT